MLLLRNIKVITGQIIYRTEKVVFVNNGPDNFESEHISMNWEPKPGKSNADLCIAYDPPGPTKASPDRVRIT